jgi:hypothetical protein
MDLKVLGRGQIVRGGLKWLNGIYFPALNSICQIKLFDYGLQIFI